MNLSGLQKYILKEVYLSRLKEYPKDKFLSFYSKEQGDKIGTISRSIERLIDRGLVTAEVHKTQHKAFIETITLTGEGERIAKEIIKDKQKLLFKN